MFGRWLLPKVGKKVVETIKSVAPGSKTGAKSVNYWKNKASAQRIKNVVSDVSATTTYNWLRPAAESLGQPVREEKMKEIEIGQGWHCFEVKKTRDGSSKPWSVVQGELRPRQENWTTSYHC